MEDREHPHESRPEARPLRGLLVGVLCIGSVAVVTGRQPLGFLLLLIAGLGLLLQRAPAKEDEAKPGVTVWSEVERLLKIVLILCAVGLSALTCFLFAIPMFPAGARPGGNDAAAIATLKNLAVEQERFRAMVRHDRDSDGRGEFGYLPDLARGTGAQPPHLSSSFAHTHALPDGTRAVRRSGFWFQVFLPDVHGHGVPAGKGIEVDPEKAEDHWCCYAWPVRPNASGKRVFYVDERGLVHWRRNLGTYGAHRTPAFDDAWHAPGPWRPLR